MFEAAREIVRDATSCRAKARQSLADLVAHVRALARPASSDMKHTELAELILDESGYTAMWQADKSPQAQSRLENLKELIRFMHQFETLAGFLEHVSLVMDAEQGDDGDRVSLMTLHARQGARVRRRVPARLGGGPVPAPALARRERPRRPRGGAPPRLCRHHAGASVGAQSRSPRTGASAASTSRRARRASSTSCRRRTSR